MYWSGKEEKQLMALRKETQEVVEVHSSGTIVTPHSSLLAAVEVVGGRMPAKMLWQPRMAQQLMAQHLPVIQEIPEQTAPGVIRVRRVG